MLFTFSYNSLYELIDGGSRVQNQHGTVKKFSLHTLEMDIPLVCKNLSSFLRFRIFKKLFRDFAEGYFQNLGIFLPETEEINYYEICTLKPRGIL